MVPCKKLKTKQNKNRGTGISVAFIADGGIRNDHLINFNFFHASFFPSHLFPVKIGCRMKLLVKFSGLGPVNELQ